jgi:hypothetical protein
MFVIFKTALNKKRLNFKPIYLKYQLHEFIVKFNIKKCKGSSTYVVTFLRRESIFEILTSYVKKENIKIEAQSRAWLKVEPFLVGCFRL